MLFILFRFGSKCIKIIATIFTFFPAITNWKKKLDKPGGMFHSSDGFVSQPLSKMLILLRFRDSDGSLLYRGGSARVHTYKSRRFSCFARLNISFWWANWFRIWLAVLRGTERMPPLLTHDLPSPPWRGRSPVCNSYSKFSRVPLAPFFITMSLKHLFSERERNG